MLTKFSEELVATSRAASCLFHAGLLLGLLFCPEDEDGMLLQNVSWLSTDYMALYP
jgi:hypothetical protein